MPLSLADSDLMPIKSAAAWLSDRLGSPVRYPTVLGWTRGNVAGRKLDTLRVGGRVYTSRSAIEAFVAGRAGEQSPVPAPAARRTEASRRMAELCGTKRNRKN